jgi:hypothetical protein
MKTGQVRRTSEASGIDVVIQGPMEKVFDLICLARLWPQWHVLTRAVGGVTEIPFKKGDRIYEFVRTPSGPMELDYEIVEHDRPHGAKMVAEDGTTVTYTFEEKADGIHFRRVMELGSETGSMPLSASDETDRLSVANLKALVENSIWRQQKGPYLG